MNRLNVSERIVDTVSDGSPMAVLRKHPTDDPGGYPAVVLFQDAPGIRLSTHEFATRLASYGFDVAVPDLFHREGRLIGYMPDEVAADPTVRPRILRLMRSLTDDGIQNDLDATLEVLVSERPSGSLAKVGCAGFCLGARVVFRTMMRLPEQFCAGAMWHPSFLVDDEPDSPHLTAGDISGHLYAGFGEADEHMTVASMQPFIKAVEPLAHVTVDILPGAEHGYTWPNTPSYNEAAAERAWSQMLTIFEEALTAT